MKVIFVAGIHAVGKSAMCEVVSKELEIPYYTASQIISTEKSSAISKGSKLVANVTDNQNLLIKGVSKILGNKDFLLDGHFTIRRQGDREIERIDVEVFSALHLAGILVITDDPLQISMRMKIRDGIALPLDQIASHQTAELTHAKAVASFLHIPCAELQAFDYEGMKITIKNWLKDTTTNY